MFVRNAWYVGAWKHEVGRQMMRRIILGEPVMFYRRNDGTPVALEDRCCHRQAPLSMGRLLGDIVQCPYHGLQFDQTGKAVKIPSQTRMPPGAQIKSYPVVERYGWVWIWMGDPALADPDLVTDFHWMDDPAWRHAGEYMHLEGNYLLLVENLLDTTHLTFIHPTTLGTDSFAESDPKFERGNDFIKISRYVFDNLPAPFHQRMGEFPDGMKVDRWQITTFKPPSFVQLDVGSAPVGAMGDLDDRSQGVNMMNLNAITPETETTTHYFWAQAYNFKLDQDWIGELIRQNVHTAFSEDLVIIKAQQQNISQFDGPTVDFGQDAAGIAARRIVDTLIDAEQAAPGRAAAE